MPDMRTPYKLSATLTVLMLVQPLGLLAKSAAGGVAPNIAAEAIAIAIGILANLILKLCLALARGTRQFRRVSGVALTAMTVASGVSIGFFR